MESIQELLEGISEEVGELNGKTNINDVSKSHKKILAKIKTTNSRIQELEKAVNSEIDGEIPMLTESEYLKIISELSEDNVERILEMDNIEEQIKAYSVFLYKTKQCVKYLEQQKMIIVNCDS